jgi:TPR repeat protein
MESDMAATTALIDMNDADRAAALAGPPEAVAALLLEAAKAGHTEAQLFLGQVYLDGRGVSRDPVEALRWFGVAAKSGNAMAMNMIGRCSEHGWGAAVDKGMAAQWYEAAARHGLDWGMYNLATLYTLGEGIAEDKAAALRLFEQAAAMGHAKSMNMIGSFYEDGWVVKPDMDKAADHYRAAAEGGDFRGQFNHARILTEKGDIAGAKFWLGKMAETATPSFLAKAGDWISAQSALA